MNRRKPQTASSLELLLDTICNTFGGVLFLAILICVLLRMASPIASHEKEQDLSTPEEFQSLQSKLEVVAAEINSLQAGLTQQDQIAAQLIQPGQRDLFQEVSRQRAERDRVLQERLHAIGELNKTQHRTAKLVHDLATLRQNLETARKEVKEQRVQLAQAESDHERLALKADEVLANIKKAQARTAPLPRQHRSSKSEVGLIVRFNRLYLWQHYNASGIANGLNTDELDFSHRLGTNVLVSPKPNAGVALDGDDATASITALLRRFDPQEVHFAVPIWGDSFESFQTLKNVIVGMGFEYRLIPMATGQVISDHGGGGDRRVQ